MNPDDPFLTALYDSLNDSPAQRKFKKIAPMPFGIVFLPSPGMTEDDVRAHFRLARQLGFNAMKQTMFNPLFSEPRIRHIALDEGIIPYWYGEGGWEEITDDLLDRLKISRSLPIDQVRTHPAMLAHQEKILRDRIDGKVQSAPVTAGDGISRVPHSVGTDIDPKYDARFLEWLKEQYVTVEAINNAWNMYAIGIAPRAKVFSDWDDVAARWRKVGNGEYRRLRDLLRFKADEVLLDIRDKVDEAIARDPNEPFRAGGEMGLFLPFASRSIDMPGIAREMARVGSFYPSLHLAWHFEEVEYEVARMIYLQSSIAADWFKGGWSATWESTGGPQQFSGGKAWNPKSALETAGFTVDAGTMSQLLLSYIAGGFKGVGLWCWNGRTAGWEAGEYALLDRNDRPSPRAVRAGQISLACQRLRDELWQTHKEPMVGVYQDWDNEAIWTGISVSNRDKFKFEPIHARIGVSRALVNANVPWEHVTADDLRRGLSQRYRVIYLPRVIAIPTDLLPIFSEYVRAGGRLIMDLPSGWFDTYGKLLPTGEGSAFEKLFGTSLDDFQYSNNAPRQLAGQKLSGFVADMHVTTARVLEKYDSGLPAITENKIGAGSAVILGCEASMACFQQGNDAMEKLLIRTALGDLQAPYASDAIVYRLAAPQADHYFFINDGPATTAKLDTKKYRYKSCIDPVTQETIDPKKGIALEAYSARWLRYEKA